ncbi:MAG TPA: YfhO family protein [Candidatus Hydrogenedentes bacterium]|nr:YfhO family protein [Candidatus Hydrogenedentota bacterium]
MQKEIEHMLVPSKDSLRTRELLLHSAVLVALLVFVFPKVFFLGHVIAPGDILFQCPPWRDYAPPGWERPANRLMSDVLTAFYPYYAISLHALQHNEWPLWNPFELAGVPLMANYQSAVFYPPRLLHVLFGLRWGTTFYILAKLWLCGMTAYLCARVLGLRRPAARFLSVGWMFASYNLIWCNWSLPDVSAWLPVVFMGTEQILAQAYRRGFFALALGGTLLLLAGHPETAFTMGLGVGIYFLCRLIYERRPVIDWLRAGGVCLAGWGLAIAVSAAQILPFLEYLVHCSTFMERVQEQKMTWLPASVSLLFWVPRFFGTSAEGNYWGAINSNLYAMVYPGIPVWVAIGVLIPSMRAERTERARAIALVTSCLLCCAFAFEVYPFSLISRLPVFSSLIIAYHVAFPVFAIPLLGAIAMDRWFEKPRTWGALIWVGLWAIPVLLLAAFLLHFFGPVIRSARLGDYVRFQLLVAVALAVVSTLLLATGSWRNASRWAPALLTVLLAIDLGFANRGLNPTMPAKDVFPETQLTTFLKNQPQPCRVGTGEGNIASGLVTVYGIEEWLGYDGLYPERIIRFQKTLGENFWKAIEPAASIQFYLHDPRFEPVFPLDKTGAHERVGQFNGLEVYRNRRALPRAFLVNQAEIISDKNALFSRMMESSFRPENVVLLERAPEKCSLPTPSAGFQGNARILEHTATRCLLETETNAPAVLVLADAYYPGWTARLDGQPAEILPAYYIFRAVVVPEGNHRVEFTYFPMSLRIGLAISAVGLVFGVFLAVTTRRRPSTT